MRRQGAKALGTALILALSTYTPHPTLFGTVAAADLPPQRSDAQAPHIRPKTAQRIFAPLPSGFWTDGEVVLNNNSPDALTVSAVFFSKGLLSVGGVLELAPSEVRWFRLSELIPESGRHIKEYDSLELRYQGRMLELGAQITLIGGNSETIGDIQFSSSMDFHSVVQHAVWSAPPGAEALIAITNSSERYVTVALDDTSQRRVVELGPYEAHNFTVAATAMTAAGSFAIGTLRVEAQGAVGAVRAAGLIHYRGRPVGAIRFYDHSLARDRDLFANNLAFGAHTRVAVRNTTDAPIQITPIISGYDEAHSEFHLDTRTLAPQAVSAIDLSSVTHLLTGDLTITSSGGAGSIIGSLVVLDSQGGLNADIPLRERGPLRRATGSYPWRVDGDYETVVAISNTSSASARFVAWIQAAGRQFTFETETLEPNSTRLFDLRAMRDSKIRAASGETLPQNITSGQFRWAMLGPGSDAQLVGRAHISSERSARHTSYSCEVCCSPSFRFGYFTPDDPYVQVLDEGQFGVRAQYQDYYGNPINNVFEYVDSWSVSNSSIATPSMISTGYAKVLGNNGGQTDFSGSWDAYTYYNPDGETCIQNEVEGYASGTAYVGRPASLDVVSDTYIDSPPSPYNRELYYRIKDQFGNYMHDANKWFVTESYNPPTGSGVSGQPKCNSGMITTGGNIYANATAQFKDNYSLNGGANPCTTIATQQISITRGPQTWQVLSHQVKWEYSGVSFP